MQEGPRQLVRRLRRAAVVEERVVDVQHQQLLARSRRVHELERLRRHTPRELRCVLRAVPHVHQPFTRQVQQVVHNLGRGSCCSSLARNHVLGRSGFTGPPSQPVCSRKPGLNRAARARTP